MEVLYISFYTPNYKGYVSGLVGSLDRLGLPHDVREVPCKGGFLANVRYKPQFILERMDAHPDVDALVWLDIDAIVNRRPALFYKLKDADMAAYFRPISGNRKQKDELLSGTLFVRNTPKVREAMDKWIAALARASHKLLKPEQQVLHRILGKLGLKVERLPQDYCWILKGFHKQMPTIEHHQASRISRYAKPGQVIPVRRVTRSMRHRIPAARRRKLPNPQKLKYRHRRLVHDPRALSRPVGGVPGVKVSQVDIQKARADLRNMSHACSLDSAQRGARFLVLGTSWSLNETDLEQFYPAVVLSCNHIMLHETIAPKVILFDDRLAYCVERDSGRLNFAHRVGRAVLLARDIFEPQVLLPGCPNDLRRRAQPCPTDGSLVFEVRRSGKPPYHPSVKSFREPLEVGGNVVCAMLQAACIMGAREIVCAGIELAWPKNKGAFFYGPGTEFDAQRPPKNLKQTLACLSEINARAQAQGVLIYNASPVTDSPFASVISRRREAVVSA